MARVDADGARRRGADLELAGASPLVFGVRGVTGFELALYLFTETLGRPTIIVPIANADETVRLGSVELAAALLTLP